jgi:hypothetical protein
MARMDHHPTFKKAMQKPIGSTHRSMLMKRESCTTKTNCRGNAMIATRVGSRPRCAAYAYSMIPLKASGLMAGVMPV